MIPQNREQVRSDEEWYFVLWLQDATRLGLVEKWEYEPVTFELFPKKTYPKIVQMKTKQKVVEKHLHHPEVYTPDFLLTLTEEGRARLFDVFEDALSVPRTNGCGVRDVWVDVKGAYNPNDQPRYFSSTRKAMYHVTGIWVEKVIPVEMTKKGKPKTGFFVSTFAPESIRWKLNGKELNVMGRSCINAEEFIKRKQ